MYTLAGKVCYITSYRYKSTSESGVPCPNSSPEEGTRMEVPVQKKSPNLHRQGKNSPPGMGSYNVPVLNILESGVTR